ncbi:hypothetical protein [Chryseobacterium sp. FH1]|uniref:hypothetical protein n=1 Tax=Chryseobacterium sp. FH1 TaxID=1233951 RepID=UPI0004E4169E|nr:hypothetical protein [Chryseobacterium sp. FH1]KFC24129.1 hypothetical protein IO90_02155 [Chryseobacterium sp. FH1]
MKYLAIILLIFISCGKSTKKQTVENLNLDKLDIFINEDINIFIQSFLSNQEVSQEENLSKLLIRYKCIGNKLRKDSLILNKIISDSLISKEDLKFIAKQINDKKNYFLEKKYFKQKIFNSDSLKKENLKFYEGQSEVIDSLLKINPELARQHSSRSNLERSKQMKNFSPYAYIEKPLFTIDKKRVIFSYTNMCCNETAIYEYKNKKWRKIKMISSYVT